MNIAIVGWGSLIWCPGSLRIRTRWRRDGPSLPIEFARISKDGRLTLVIHDSSPEQRTYWALSELRELEDARQNLVTREGTNAGRIHYVRREGRPEGGSAEVARTLEDWMKPCSDIDAVVWTGLQSNWENKQQQSFTVDSAVAYLLRLENDRVREKERYDRARQYVTHAPSTIDTPVRKAMRARGWNDVVLSPALFE